MFLRPWLEYLKADSPHRLPLTGHKLFLEPLEDRNLLSGGLSPTLVALGGATPRPIPLPLSAAASPFSPPGPDIYLNFPGPVDAPLNPLVGGNEQNTITDFIGLYGGARVQGDGQGHEKDGTVHTYFWDADLRFMQGVYRGVNGNLYARTFIEV